MSRRRKVPQKKKSQMKFSKKIVVTCITVIILYTIAQTYLSYSLSIELSPTLTTCVYAFFGTELAATAIIRIFDKEDNSVRNTDSSAKSEQELQEDSYG